MKRLFFIIVLSLIIITSCTKQSVNHFSGAITGKWIYSESFYSIGGPAIFVPASPANQWVDFKTDGTVSSSMPLFSTITRYSVLDSIRVKFFDITQPTGFQLFSYYIDTINSRLVLSSLDHICIEGCGYRFIQK